MVKLNGCIFDCKWWQIKRHNDFWSKVGNSTKKEFDYKPNCNKSFLETKTKSDGDKAIDFILLLDFVLKVNENYYLQIILKQSKYIEKEKKVIWYITNDLGTASDEFDKEEFSFTKCVKIFTNAKNLSSAKAYKTVFHLVSTC